MNKKRRAVIGTCLCVLCLGLVVWLIYRSNFAAVTPENSIHGDSPVPAVFESAAVGDLDAVSAAIEGGTDINIRHPGNDRTLLHFAVNYQKDDVAEYLVGQGIDCDSADVYQCTPLMLAVLNGSQREYDLLKDRASFDVQDLEGNTLLHLAASSGAVGIFRDLLERGLDPAAVNSKGNPVICYAGTAEMLEAVMAALDTEQLSPDLAKKILFCALSPEIVDYLTAHTDLDINVCDGDQNNALFYAEQNNVPDVFRALIRSGADVNCQNHDGNTPLHICAADGTEDYIRDLLEAGADKSVRNNDGQTPYDVAVFYQNTAAAEILGGTNEH